MILPDVLAPDLDLVLCGTAPSRASKEAAAYYAKPGNRFWPTLHLVGLTPRLLKPHEYPEVTRYGLGLTDLCKTEWGSDQELTKHCFDVSGFVAKIDRYRPAAVAFDSKNAGKTFFRRAAVQYGLQEETLFGAAIFIVPSPSGRARSHWDTAPWQELGEFVARRRAARRP
ncbi:mismatch-specific DNA-glycosylase [Skermanella rosea]|uniref:mismatch-specific DNA-glycosylase n=1 Tax=Skermanella rosea TaxID=1817965 RepID=UPI0019313DBD|nr:mismatch-specific DNA-glycosylase [Skermanella rosea]UEM05029.1 mismatch-specific DNA-glycosylase [Skermanella rosea]